MSWDSRKYDVYFVLGDPALEPAWREDRWALLAAALDPLMPSPRGKASVRTTHVTPEDKEIRFGRIGWNARGHAKWTHKIDTPDAVTNGAEFMDLEVWTPSWTKCDEAPPDAFVGMSSSEGKRRAGFDPMLVIASARDRETPSGEDVRACAETAAEVLSAVLRAHVDRLFTHAGEGRDFLGAINDTYSFGVLKRPQLRGPGPLSLSDLKGPWEAF